MLAYPDSKAPYDLHCDASDSGLGAVLVQKVDRWHVASRTLTDAEKNYSTTEKEALAIVWSLDYFHPYIYAATFTIHTDHAALKSILSTEMPKGRIAAGSWLFKDHQFTISSTKRAYRNEDADASQPDRTKQPGRRRLDCTKIPRTSKGGSDHSALVERGNEAAISMD